MKLFYVLLLLPLLAFAQFQTTDAIITIDLPVSIELQTTDIECFIEERDLQSQIQLYTGIPIVEALVIVPQVVSQNTSSQNPVVVHSQTPADGKYWQVGAVAKDSTGSLLSLVSCSGIIQKPNIPEVILNVTVTFE